MRGLDAPLHPSTHMTGVDVLPSRPNCALQRAVALRTCVQHWVRTYGVCWHNVRTYGECSPTTSSCLAHTFSLHCHVHRTYVRIPVRKQTVTTTFLCVVTQELLLYVHCHAVFAIRNATAEHNMSAQNKYIYIYITTHNCVCLTPVYMDKHDVYVVTL